MSQETTTPDAAAARIQGTSRESLQTVREIGRRIREAVQGLTSIAQQTNLLALNTMIAATRSGDAGPRFAEMAHDIKVLAQRTATAADDLSGLAASLPDSAIEAVTTIERDGR